MRTTGMGPVDVVWLGWGVGAGSLKILAGVLVHRAFELVAVWLNAKPDKTRDVCAGPVSSGRVEMKSLPVKSAVSSAVSGACGTSGSTREGTNSTVELLRVVSGDFLNEGVRVCYRRPSPKSPSPKTRQGIHSSVTYPRYNTLRTGRTGGRPPEHTPIPLFCGST